MGDQEIPVQSGQLYKIQQVPGEKTSGIPTQGESPFEGEFTLREGKSSVRYGFNKNTGKVEEIVRGRPIESTAAAKGADAVTTSPQFNAIASNPGVKAIVAPIANKLKDAYGVRERGEIATAAVLNGTPIVSDKVSGQMEKLNTAKYLMKEAFDASARIQGFANADAMLAEANVPQTLREAMMRTATLQNLSESGKGYAASFVSLPDAQKVDSLAGALRFLLPRGWGEVGNLAQQESESALKLAAEIGDNVPQLVANWDLWTNLTGSISNQLRGESMQDVERARAQLLELGLVDASMFKGGGSGAGGAAQPAGTKPSKYKEGQIGVDSKGNRRRWTGSGWSDPIGEGQ
jgi:hypothetical protein